MNGFVAPPPLNPAEIPPELAADVLLEGGDWWPDINLVELRQLMRVDPAIHVGRLREAAIGAVLSVRRELRDWKAAHQEAGVASLADLPGEEVDGLTEAVFLYTRAVYSSAAAELIERLRDLGTTASGHDRDDELQAAAGEHRRAERSAIRDLLGATRITAELL